MAAARLSVHRCLWQSQIGSAIGSWGETTAWYHFCTTSSTKRNCANRLAGHCGDNPLCSDNHLADNGCDDRVADNGGDNRLGGGNRLADNGGDNQCLQGLTCRYSSQWAVQVPICQHVLTPVDVIKVARRWRFTTDRSCVQVLH